MLPACRLCQSQDTRRFQNESPSLAFFKCQDCGLIFKDPRDDLDPTAEKKRYSLHRNHIEDSAYVDFLSPAVQQVKKHRPAPARGLDYGCGPSPVLCQLLERENYQVEFYDPHFFFRDLSQVKNLDFVTCTEAAEHFYNPGEEFKKILALLKPGGILVLMTDLFQKEMNMTTWSYARDPTHVCFFSDESLRWIAKIYHLKLEIHSPRLVTFKI